MRIAARMGTIGTESAFEVSARARALEAQGRSIIHLQIGEPDFDTPANVRAAAKAALDAGATHYPPFAGIPTLREAIAATPPRARAFAVEPYQVFVTVGGKGVMLYAILGLVDPGDEVLVPDPGYPIYESLTRFVGATPVPIPIRMSNDFRLDVDELASLVTPRTRVLVINSPANPTGGVLTRSDLERIAELAIRHDLWVLADEIYGRILYDGAEHVSIASLPGMAERTIVLDGFSKTYRHDRLADGLRHRPRAAGQDLRPAHHQHDQRGRDVRPGRRGRGARRAAGRRGRDGRRVQGTARPHRRRPQRDPRDRVPPPGRRVLRLPVDRRDRAVRRRPGRAAAPGGRRVRPARARRSAGSATTTSGSATPTRRPTSTRRSSASGSSSSRSWRPAYERAAARLRGADHPRRGARPGPGRLRRGRLGGRPAAAA